MSHITWTYEDENTGEPVSRRIPAKWEICHECQGNGSSSAWLGSFTAEEFEDSFDFEEQAAYFEGAYDKPCEVCHSSGKLLVPDWEVLAESNPALCKAYEEHCQWEADYEAEMRREHRWGY